jgi:hypothetical protein
MEFDPMHFCVPSGDNNKVEKRLKWEFELDVSSCSARNGCSLETKNQKKKKTTKICENSVYKRRRHLRISISRDPTRAPG